MCPNPDSQATPDGPIAVASSRKVVILCANPALDEEWEVDGVRREEKNRVLRKRQWAGGKGVNVARWLGWLRVPARLVLLAGGEPGRTLLQLLRREGIRYHCIPVSGATRVNVLVTDPRGRQWRFNPEGPRVGLAEWRSAVAAVVEELQRSSLLILSGSLPPGVPARGYAELVRRARRMGVRVVLDCDGPTLGHAVPAGPFLVKPNEAELREWARTFFRAELSLKDAARRMSEMTGGWVLVSRGGRPALLVHARLGIERAMRPPHVRPRNRLGAGDAFVAGVCRAILHDGPPDSWLRSGLLVGSVATQYPGGVLPPRARLKTVLRAAGGSRPL